MTFISYAQNLEDIMLYRALKHVGRGFYVDVGAYHPVIDSVTKAFYDLGWRGINIEPNPECLRHLMQDRPRDLNLGVAVGGYQGDVLFFEVLQDGAALGTSTVNRVYADSYAQAGYEVLGRTVPCTTLDAICAEHAVETVHFLKIDAEGAEKDVLEGFAFTNVRPWIVVIEANKPEATEDISHQWEPIILSKNYAFVYYDGLNRYYLAAERADLQAHFRVPPNCFDHYVTYAHWRAQEGLSQAGAELRAMERALAAERVQQDSLASQLRLVYASRSWRITAPLRKSMPTIRAVMLPLGRALRRVRGGILRGLMRDDRLRDAGATDAGERLPESARQLYVTLCELVRTGGGKS